MAAFEAAYEKLDVGLPEEQTDQRSARERAARTARVADLVQCVREGGAARQCPPRFKGCPGGGKDSLTGDDLQEHTCVSLWGGPRGDEKLQACLGASTLAKTYWGDVYRSPYTREVQGDGKACEALRARAVPWRLAIHRADAYAAATGHVLELERSTAPTNGHGRILDRESIRRSVNTIHEGMLTGRTIPDLEHWCRSLSPDVSGLLLEDLVYTPTDEYGNPRFVGNSVARLASLVEFLVSQDPGPSSAARSDAFEMAALRGHASVARVLLDDSSPRRGLPDGDALSRTLSAVAGKGYTEVVQLLLQDQRDPRALPDAKDSGGFIHAAWKGHTEVVRLLLQDQRDHRARPDAKDSLALIEAAENGHTEVVRLLLQGQRDHRARPDAKDSLALIGAASNGHAEVVRLLLRDKRQHRAQPDIKRGTELYEAALRRQREGRAGRDVRLLSELGTAALPQEKEVMRLLLEDGRSNAKQALRSLIYQVNSRPAAETRWKHAAARLQQAMDNSAEAFHAKFKFRVPPIGYAETPRGGQRP